MYNGVAHNANGKYFGLIIKFMENNILSAINKNLSITDTHTVQPNILIRTALFTPVAKNSNKPTSGMAIHDVTAQFKSVEIFRKEGYDYAIIRGDRLNVRTDFKVWCGVIFAFSKYGYTTNRINMKLSEFTKFCGFSTRVINTDFRKRMEDSLDRIKSQTIKMATMDSKRAMSTSLIHTFKYDHDKDEILLEADPNLWELYRVDHQILLSLKILNKIPRIETAQCLYLYLASLPENPYPVTISRLRERLSLNTSTKEANRAIRAAIAKLEEVGYLKGFQTKTPAGEWAYEITDRLKMVV